MDPRMERGEMGMEFYLVYNCLYRNNITDKAFNSIPNLLWNPLPSERRSPQTYDLFDFRPIYFFFENHENRDLKLLPRTFYPQTFAFSR